MFLRAFLAVFYPELAEEASVTFEGIVDDEGLFEYHSGLMGSDCGAVTEYLATAVSEKESQLCYERLLNLSVESHAQRECERVKLKSKKARSGSRVNDTDKKAGAVAKEECLRESRCFTMGFRELCDESAQFVSEVVRVSQSGLIVQGSTMPVEVQLQWLGRRPRTKLLEWCRQVVEVHGIQVLSRLRAPDAD